MSVPNTFIKLVSTAGTAVRLSETDLTVDNFRVMAQSSNEGKIVVGDADVSITNSIYLNAGDVREFDGAKGSRRRFTNLKDWYVNSEISGEGIIVEYGTSLFR